LAGEGRLGVEGKDIQPWQQAFFNGPGHHVIKFSPNRSFSEILGNAEKQKMKK